MPQSQAPSATHLTASLDGLSLTELGASLRDNQQAITSDEADLQANAAASADVRACAAAREQLCLLKSLAPTEDAELHALLANKRELQQERNALVTRIEQRKTLTSAIKAHLLARDDEKADAIQKRLYARWSKLKNGQEKAEQAIIAAIFEECGKRTSRAQYVDPFEFVRARLDLHRAMREALEPEVQSATAEVIAADRRLG